MHDLVVDLIAVAVCGALGGFANVFIGDSGLHLPTIDQGIFRPGYIGVVFVGLIAAGSPIQALTAANKMR